MKLQLLFLALFLSGIHVIYSLTDPHDVAVLYALKDTWKNTLASWGHSEDPCGLPIWEGVTCNNSRVTALKLSTMDLEGKLESDIGELTELTSLTLTSNNLIGKILPSLSKLSKLYWLDILDNMLIGPLPISTTMAPGLDLLLKAKHFHFNKNKLSGPIPAKLFRSNMKLIHMKSPDGSQGRPSLKDQLQN
ncbi:hypothetical protein I3842_Q088900 [Carya illinoinensis]|uniref:Leucine-rich repeat-containing N-terminal plant-type domain-containing protein n=1 Tax=Carya illinoinensis TaxID=32201 RepID=A0A921ZY57_CARIL|nr:hypothetical protein I3842_Q088900 [Carya illinoinensis]